ncbi:MAG: hypothetical protein J6U43_00025 [Bacteroidales bacterium]|nr:hypothetical protein [Bacteroidales bacterium]
MSEKINNNNQDVETKPVAEKNHIVLVIMGMIMVAIYFAMAFLLVFTTLFVGKMPEWVRFVMGAVFFVYGIFRGYRVYKAR